MNMTKSIQISESGETVLKAIHRLVYSPDAAVLTRDSYHRVVDAILFGGFGDRVEVYSDGPTEGLSLVLHWYQGANHSFTLGVIWRKDSQEWTLHS